MNKWKPKYVDLLGIEERSWYDTTLDNLYYRNNLIFKNKKDAQKKYKEIIKLLTKEARNAAN